MSHIIHPKVKKKKNSGSEIPYDRPKHDPLLSNQERQQNPKLKRIVREKAFDGRMKRKIWKIRGKKDLHLLSKDKTIILKEP